MKRYDVLGTDSCVEERQNGEYVEYEDAARIIAQRDRLAEASTAFLEMYFKMAASGDCGNWDPGMEKEVVDLQHALAELDKEKQS